VLVFLVVWPSSIFFFLGSMDSWRKNKIKHAQWQAQVGRIRIHLDKQNEWCIHRSVLSWWHQSSLFQKKGYGQVMKLKFRPSPYLAGYLVLDRLLLFLKEPLIHTLLWRVKREAARLSEIRPELNSLIGWQHKQKRTRRFLANFQVHDFIPDELGDCIKGF